MLKENKVKIILSSIITLLPCLFGVLMWNKLPEMAPIHWGMDGNPDGLGSKAFAVFGLPSILLVIHLLCLFLTSLDKNQKGQNKKALGIIFWIIPFLSLLVNSFTYFAMFGKEFNMAMFMPLLFGVLFVYIGNYLPKVKQNRTLGIKISWTLSNEENWNKTHRFGGKTWFFGGFVVIFTAFLPLKIMVTVLVSVMILMISAPMVYSYLLYRKHKKEGIEYNFIPRGKVEKTAVRITAVVVPLILIGTMVLMFTGNMNFSFEETSFTITASYHPDLEVDYSEIDSIEYRESFDVGIRTYGFGSARLSMGTFQNDEFGNYTLYAYTGNKAAVVLKSEEKVLVIKGKTESATKKIYQELLEKVNN